ncbi:hypothetical protein [Dethiothermospora halolimnae]|uniref:hypothetical protein n=1 Tax=Dethiothermospora halolimnae TaxID=3114390 RepID=UPI003CCBA11F
MNILKKIISNKRREIKFRDKEINYKVSLSYKGLTKNYHFEDEIKKFILKSIGNKKYNSMNKKYPQNSNEDIVIEILNNKSKKFIKCDDGEAYRKNKFDSYLFLKTIERYYKSIEELLELNYYKIAKKHKLNEILFDGDDDEEIEYLFEDEVQDIESLRLELGLNLEKVKNIFLRVSNRINKFKLELSPNDAWEILIKEIEKYKE